MSDQKKIVVKNIDVNRGNSQAQIPVTATLVTTPAQKLMERNFPYVQAQIYKITYLSKIVAKINKTDEIVEACSKEVEVWLEEAIKALNDEQQRLETLIDQNGLTSVKINYTNPIKYQTGIKTPKGRILLDIISTFDVVCQLSDKLFLGGIFEEDQNQKLQYIMKRVIEKRCGRIRNTANRLDKAQKKASELIDSDEVVELVDGIDDEPSTTETVKPED
jgi:hypothetical protein